MKNKLVPFICIFLITTILSSTNALANHDRFSTDQELLSASMDTWNMDLIGQVGGSVDTVAVQDYYAYIGAGTRMIVLDIMDPSNPIVTGYTQPFPDCLDDIFIQGEYAYVADELGGLRIVRISEPYNLVEEGFYALSASASGVSVSGNYAYVAAESGGLRVIDISNPSSPTEVGNASTPSSANGVAVSESYAFVITYSTGLRVFSIANPYQPVEVGFIDTPGWGYSVAISGDYAYVADLLSGLRVIDISNPEEPIELGYIDTPVGAWDVAVIGPYAYVADWTGGLRIINISNPISPIEVGYYLTSDALGVVASDGFAYIADGEGGLKIINVSSPTNPSIVSNFIQPGASWDVAVSGSFAYVANYGVGMSVVNVTSPDEASNVGFYDSPGNANGVAVSGNYAYLADGYQGLRVVNITNPYYPVEVSFYNSPGFARDVVISGDYAYVADGNSGLRIIDVSNPSILLEVGFYDTPGSSYNLIVRGNYAYIADYTSGLRIIDITDPTAPYEVGFFDTPGWAYSVALAWDYAYVADVYEGLRIIDVTDPANPSEIFVYNPDAQIRDVVISGLYAYVSGSEFVQVFDISDPINPIEVGHILAPAHAESIAIADAYIYFADGGAGLLILRHFMADISFRPNPDGYYFKNYGEVNLTDFTMDDMIRMFGQDAVCFTILNDICIPTKSAILWNVYANLKMSGGHCDGMASTSLRYFTDLDSYSGIDSSYDLDLGNNIQSTWQGETFITNVRRSIAYFHVEQFTPPVVDYKDQIRQQTPSQVLEQLATAMSSGLSNPTTLFVRQEGEGGHAVTPYAISDLGYAIYWIWVYDNNHPNNFTQHVVVDAYNNTWSYDLGWTTWSGDKTTDTFGIVPLSLYSERPECPWCQTMLSSEEQSEVWFSGSGHLLITDSFGNQLGYLDEEFVNNIPGAYPGVVDGGMGVEIEPIYILPTSTTYTILLDGQSLSESGSSNMAQFGPGYAVSIEDIDVSPSTQDIVTFTNDGTQVVYQSSCLSVQSGSASHFISYGG